MDKVKLFQSMPWFIKNLLATYRGYQLKSLRALNRESFLKEIKEKDHWSKEQIQKYQSEQLKSMLDHAVKHVPYYRNLWKDLRQVHPGLDHLDLNNWPVLEKDTIRSQPDAFICEGIDKQKLTHIPTSGTSGKPMNFYFDKHTISYWYALYEYRTRNWNGVKETDRWANAGGQLICAVDQKKPPFWTWNSIMHQLYLSSYHIAPENIAYYAEAIRKYKVVYLLGYVSSIYSMASEALRQNIELPKLKLIITTAEPLLQHQRETMEKAFGCPAIQTYSACEFVFGSNEDLEGNIYIWPEAGYVEIMDAEGKLHPEGTGELITTGFLNKAMPLIRYRLGDTVKVNRGYRGSKNFDFFEEIIGRTDDMVCTADGKMVGRLDPVFKSNIRIRESQIIQEDIDRFTIVLVPDKGFSEEDKAAIAERLRDRVGQNASVQFRITDQIPRGPNGKFKAVISRVKQNHNC